ncbi:MAG: colanic acid biosynthesis glycosyl transferase WcaI [Mucilaginibacter sp.]|nr:colanic acid biosynthesis glycosyl transferase WcaI [Mucilaginibacter sp.]
MANKNILLISHNFSPEPTGIGKYNGEMMEWFAKNGYDCTVITTFPYYPFWKVQAPYKNRWYKKEVIKYSESNSSITIYRCPSYVPSKPTGKRRMIQDMSYWVSMSWVVWLLILTKKKYDLIITVAPPFHLGYLGLKLRNRLGGKLVYHIQDLQIEAAHNLNMIRRPMLVDKLYKLEKHLLTNVDFISSISHGMMNRIKTKANKEVLFFPNWVDTSYFYPIPEREKLKTKWGYQSDNIIYLYSGAIGEKQGLENILVSAEKLKDNQNIKFIICGAGPYKNKLVKTVKDKALVNVSFLPVQDKNVFNEFLNMADVHLILQKANAEDLVMPSKLSTILAVGGICIVTSYPDTSLYKVIKEYDLGHIVPPESQELLEKKILEVSLNKSEVEKMRNNARSYAEKYLNLNNIMNDFIAQVL